MSKKPPKAGDPQGPRDSMQGNTSSSVRPGAANVKMPQGGAAEGYRSSASEDDAAISPGRVDVAGEISAGFLAQRTQLTSMTGNDAMTVQGAFRSAHTSRLTSAANDDDIIVQGAIRAGHPGSERSAADMDVDTDIIQGSIRQP
jgi:hypothetical protein